MRKIIAGMILWVSCLSVHAQQEIQFDRISFEEAKVKARESNKLIFFDAYTSWCAPCKWMENNVFNRVEIATFYNDHFINTKFDCEAGEGISLARQYEIKSFPTYLFLDGDGTLVYRTQSRMEAAEFLAEAKRAIDPNYQLPVLDARYTSGDRDPTFLLRYIFGMGKADPDRAKQATADLDNIADPSFLKSRDGWEAIYQLARSTDDKYGKFFFDNIAYFRTVAPKEAFEEKQTQLLRYAMYGYIRNKNEKQFNETLQHFSNNEDMEMKMDAAMFEVEWVGAHGTDDEFVMLTEKLRKGLLKQEAEKLSFIARRYAGKISGRPESDKVMEQCYTLAKQAVNLDPNSYSNQGTFAEICISMKRKSEAIAAAEAARALAELETSKIQKIADDMVARAKNL